jgi:hypothetical protein
MLLSSMGNCGFSGLSGGISDTEGFPYNFVVRCYAKRRFTENHNHLQCTKSRTIKF